MPCKNANKHENKKSNQNYCIDSCILPLRTFSLISGTFHGIIGFLFFFFETFMCRLFPNMIIHLYKYIFCWKYHWMFVSNSHINIASAPRSRILLEYFREIEENQASLALTESFKLCLSVVIYSIKAFYLF